MEAEEYRRTAIAEEDHWWFWELRRIARRLSNRPAGSGLLDAGCGTGGNLRALAGGAGPVVGLDRSAEALAWARGRCGALLVRGSVGALPFRDGAFSRIVCADVLYHAAVHDDLEALRELRRVLAPGGEIFVNVPAFESLRSAHDRAMHTARRYTRGRLRARIREAGLAPLWVSYWNGLLLFPAILVRLLRRGSSGGSEIVPLPRPLNVLLKGVAWIDASLCALGLLPAGLSVAAVARREG